MPADSWQRGISPASNGIELARTRWPAAEAGDGIRQRRRNQEARGGGPWGFNCPQSVLGCRTCCHSQYSGAAIEPARESTSRIGPNAGQARHRWREARRRSVVDFTPRVIGHPDVVMLRRSTFVYAEECLLPGLRLE